MVDFKKLRVAAKAHSPIDPLQVFQRLPKPENINDLWDGQSKALSAWHERRKENDLVIKLNTGGGKTLVGLLIAQSLLNELGEPVLYLCPTNQLVDQTAEKAAEVGLPAQKYQGEVSADFLNGKTILIAPYHALFNGLSKFGVIGSGHEPIKLGGIICDDAHAALPVLRDQFTIRVTKEALPELYADLAARFRADFGQIGKIGTFDDIVERDDFGVLEVPYSAWLAKENEIRELIARDHSDAFKFQLPLLRGRFDFCHALISAKEFAITVFHPFVDMFPSFSECKRRVYMSATIADDSSLVRSFDASPTAVAKPIAPASLAGVGERMVLVPALMDLKEEPEAAIREVIAHVKKDNPNRGIIILTQSEYRARRWKDVAEVKVGNDVAATVKTLQAGTDFGPFALAGRYDGIDLAGDMCRILILDGLPTGTHIYYLFRAEVLRGNSSINMGYATRVEQGMGRGTRGAGDYCVVFLVGEPLTSWISRKASLQLMTGSTRTQIEIGDDVSRSIRSSEELKKAADQCLSRDREWTRYHAETLADRTDAPQIDQQSIDVAAAERRFLSACLGRDFPRAIEAARAKAEDGALDRNTRGWLLQLAARAALFAKQDQQSDDLQKAAYAANNLLFPAREAPAYEAISEPGEQVGNLLMQMSEYALRKGIAEELADTVSILTPAATSNQFEEALKRFGELLGFKAQRPEAQFRTGPDVIWIVSGRIFVIECKHRKDPKNALTKEEHGQFLTSMEWAKANYPKLQKYGFIVHPTDAATKAAAAGGTAAMPLDALGQLVSTARQFYGELVLSPSTGAALEKACSELLNKYKLTPDDIFKAFTCSFKEQR